MNRKKVKLSFELFIIFLKIGALTFGSGYAMIPLISREVVFRKQWINENEMLEMAAISEATPGSIGVNSATFIGYKIGGFFGALAATIGVVLPSFVIILTISFILAQFESIKIIKYAFMGIRAGVLALIVKALVSLFKQCPKNLFSYIIICLSFSLVTFLGANVVIVILCCGIFGIVQALIIKKAGNKL